MEPTGTLNSQRENEFGKKMEEPTIKLNDDVIN